MKQTLIIIRGGPATGKTTLCETLRNSDKKIAWVSVDGIKPIFSNYEDRDADISYRTTIVVIKYLLEEGYSLVFDGIFTKPEQLAYLNEIIEFAKSKSVIVKVYQLVCSPETAVKRHESRNWTSNKTKEESEDIIRRLNQKVLDNPIEGAITLNTEENSLEECLTIISKNFD